MATIKIYNQNQKPTERPPVVLLSNPGLRQETLLALLRSIPQVGCVHPTASFNEATPYLRSHASALVIVDYSLPEDELVDIVLLIRSLSAAAYILLLAGRPHESLSLAGAAPNAILGSGFSSALLVEEVQKAISSQRLQ